MKKQHWLYIGITAVFICLMAGVFIGRNLVNRTSVLEPEIEADGCIDINTATIEQLTLLPGIGQTLAERIIAYRTDRGPFQKTSELMNVTGIGEKKYKQIEKFIKVGEANENPGG